MDIIIPVVNAFTANDQGGNPTGVVLSADSLSDDQMQAIAHYVGAAESAFVLPDKAATFRLRFFTPTVEVPLCGHATIATWSHLFNQSEIAPGAYTQQTQAGLIRITIDPAGLVFMEQPVQAFGKILDIAGVCEGLGIPQDWINAAFTPQIVQDTLMLCFKSKDLLNRFSLDKNRLLALDKTHSFQGLHIFVMLDDDILAAVRDFDPIVGIDEDAATGTANGSFLTYLKHYRALPTQPIYKIEQGEAMGQLSHIYGKFQGDRVWVGGIATKTKDLSYNL